MFVSNVPAVPTQTWVSIKVNALSVPKLSDRLGVSVHRTFKQQCGDKSAFSDKARSVWQCG